MSEKDNSIPAVLRRRAKALEQEEGYNYQFVSVFYRAADHIAAIQRELDESKAENERLHAELCGDCCKKFDTCASGCTHLVTHLRAELDAAKSLSVAYINRAENAEQQVLALQSWQESVLSEVGRDPCRYGNAAPHHQGVMNHDDENGMYVLYVAHKIRAEHLAARLVEAQKMLVSIREGGLIPAHFKRTHAKLAELIVLDDGRRNFDDFIDELSPAPKTGGTV